jgi:NADH:ubiquinone oxidoreductase subunit D
MRADPHIGLPHRGTEKLIESRTYLQACLILIVLIMSMMAQDMHILCVLSNYYT